MLYDENFYRWKDLRSKNPLLVIVLSCLQIGSLSSSTANQRAAQNNYWVLGCHNLYLLNFVSCIWFAKKNSKEMLQFWEFKSNDWECHKNTSSEIRPHSRFKLYSTSTKKQNVFHSHIVSDNIHQVGWYSTIFVRRLQRST